MDEWNESFWRDLSNEAFSSQVMSLYDSLTAEQRRAITNYMPAIPIPKILFKATSTAIIMRSQIIHGVMVSFRNLDLVQCRDRTFR